MAGNTTFQGPAGVVFRGEDIGSSLVLPAVKIHTGALGVDGGPVASNNPLYIQGATLTLANANSLATTGIQIKSGSGVVYWLGLINTTGGAIFGHVFDATATQTNGTVPLQPTASTANNGQTTTTLGHTIHGLPFTNGLWLQMSTTLQTMTATASTSVAYRVLYS